MGHLELLAKLKNYGLARHGLKLVLLAIVIAN